MSTLKLTGPSCTCSPIHHTPPIICVNHPRHGYSTITINGREICIAVVCMELMLRSWMLGSIFHWPAKSLDKGCIHQEERRNVAHKKIPDPPFHFRGMYKQEL